MKNKILFSILAVVTALSILVGYTIVSQTISIDPELPISQELQEVLDQGLQQYKGFGMSAAVIVPGYAPWVGVSGFSQANVPITPDMVFHAGSVSKNFIAALTLQLVEEGKLTLDDAIADWLPPYPNVDSSITIRQLLSHRSGLFQINEYPGYLTQIFGEPTRFWTPEETLNNFVLEPYFPKGTDFHYANTNYILLGLIIEEATGSAISTELRQRFFDPLGMDRTFMIVDEPATEPIAYGWFNLSNYAPNIDVDDGYDVYLIPSQIALHSVAWTAGGIVTTPHDLATWANALFHEKTILSQQTLDEMLTFMPVKGYDIVDGYGLGAYRIKPGLLGDMEIYGHGGNIYAYKTACLYIPQYGVSISMMYNWDDQEPMMVLGEMITAITEFIESNS